MFYSWDDCDSLCTLACSLPRGEPEALPKPFQPVLGECSELHTQPQSLRVPLPTPRIGTILSVCYLCPDFWALTHSLFLTVHYRKISAWLEGIVQRKMDRRLEPEGITGMGCQDLVRVSSRQKERRARRPQRSASVLPFCAESSKSSHLYWITLLRKWGDQPSFVFQLFSRFRCNWRWYTAPVTIAGYLPFQ